MGTFVLVIRTEAKDECESGAGRDPSVEELASVMSDLLCDATKREYSLPWRVTGVQESAYE